MRIGIVGSGGRFGSAAASYLISKGLSVHGIHGRDFSKPFLDSVDFAILAVPISAAISIIEDCGDRGKVIEIGSVKRPFMKYKGEIISIHPLFGPLTMGNDQFRDIIFVKDLSVARTEDIISAIFPDSLIRPMTADDHDRLMSDLLVKPYILALLGREMGYSNHEVRTGSFAKFQSVANIANSESPEVLMDTITLNPYSQEAITSASLALQMILDEQKKRRGS